MIRKCRDLQGAAALFSGWQETLIWSCLEGVMGEIYEAVAEDDSPVCRKTPESAAAVIGDFTFFGGKPSRELAAYRPDSRKDGLRILVPSDDAWAGMIEACYGSRARRIARYAIKKEPDVFSEETLRKAVDTLGKEYSLRAIDEEMYGKCLEEDWSRDLVAQFASFEDYKRLGLGVVVLKDGTPVSGASSYTAYKGGIEIEIDTRKEYRRRGLAFACGAKLILMCMERGLYPSWDAQNLWSVALAEKLGYHFDHEYTAYEVSGQEEV